jgi:hypothetical protein
MALTRRTLESNTQRSMGDNRDSYQAEVEAVALMRPLADADPGQSR